MLPSAYTAAGKATAVSRRGLQNISTFGDSERDFLRWSVQHNVRCSKRKDQILRFTIWVEDVRDKLHYWGLIGILLCELQGELKGAWKPGYMSIV